ncbi:MAG: RNA polymerase sigma-70 factor (ECF subfamily) [Oceanospirillaceae bacterium]|jgi:RNA polymerase sigma-70 factor (ECF subfamily)
MFETFWPNHKVTFDKTLLNDLYRYALSLAHEEHQAYDLLQSCCEKALSKKIDQQSLKPYMLRMIRNQFIDQYRRNKLELVVDTDFSAQEKIDEQVTLQDLEQIAIDKQHVALILDKLDYQDRELLYLWAVEGITMQELAERTNTPRGTLLARLSRLKKRLKKQYSHLIDQVS